MIIGDSNFAGASGRAERSLIINLKENIAESFIS